MTHNDGKYYAYITVGDNDIKKGESANPVKTLRMRYDAWVKAGARRTAAPGPTLYKLVTTAVRRGHRAAADSSTACTG